MHKSADTIFALCTPMGRSGLAVVRVSGPRALESLGILSNHHPNDRYIAYMSFTDPVSRETIDHGVGIFYKGPKSYTGEDTVEYNLHGGSAIIKHMLSVLSGMDGHRMAEPGEFTRRAFENGKIDLTEAEAVADLIHAETQMQKNQALWQLEKGLSTLYTAWTEQLKKILAHLEADIEFPDEDLPEDLSEKFGPEITALLGEINAHLNDNRRGERLRDGLQIAVIGAPNAGKSSLVNALAQRDVAIVSDIAGTTRDVLEVHLDLGGYPVILADTAGLRPDQIGAEGQDAIESEGIRRALRRAEEADIKLLLFDGAQSKADQHTLGLMDEDALCVINKADQPGALDIEGLKISAKTGLGLDVLLEALREKIEGLMGTREVPSLTRQRHRSALEEACTSLERSLSAALPELMAEDLRLAIRSLGRITGKVDVEDLLDVIFNDFCIGK